MEEVFKDIENYEGLYQISNLGNVKSLKKGIILKQKNGNRGYKEATLTKNGKGKTITVHRLVAKTFIPNLENKEQVNHIDGNKQNNRVDNLEWITNYDNMQHSIRIGLRDYKKIAYISKVKNGKKINQYDLDGNFIKEFLTIRDAERELGIDRQAIIRVCKGKNKRAKQYIFKYVEG